MFGRVIHQTKAGRCEGKQLQTHSSFPASKSVVPWQQAQPCDQTSLKRHKNNPLSKMIKEGNVIQLVFCSTLLRVSWLYTSFLPNCSDSSLQLALGHWGRTPALPPKLHNPSQQHGQHCHNSFQPPTGKNHPMASIFREPWLFSQGSGMFFLGN